MKKILFVLLLLFSIIGEINAQGNSVNDKLEGLSYLNKMKSFSSPEEIKHALEYAYLLRVTGQYDHASQVCLKGVKSCQKLKTDTAGYGEEFQFQLGLTFLQKGEWKLADRIFAQGLLMAESAYPKDHWKRIRYMNCIAAVALFQSDFIKAEGYLTRAAEAISRSKESAPAIKVYNNIIRARYYKIKGEYAASEALLRLAYNQVLNIADDHELKAEIYLEYASLYKQLHSYARSNVELVRAEKLYQNLSPTHPKLQEIKIARADLYLLVGENDSVKSIVSNAKFIKLLQPSELVSHFDALRIYGRYFSLSGQFNRADSLYAEISEVIPAFFGEKTVYHADYLLEKADFYFRAGRYEEALGTFQLTIDLQKDLLDYSHQSYINALNGVAYVSWALGRNSLAAQAFKKSSSNYLNQFSKNLVFLSEKEKSILYNEIRTFFDHYNRFILEEAARNQGKTSLLTEMYNNQLATKAFLFQSNKELKTFLNQSNDQLLKEKSNQWLDGKEQLSKLYKLNEEDLRERNISIDSIENYVNSIEKELNLRNALASGGSKDEVVECANIHQALSENEVAVELIRVTDFSPDSGGVEGNKIYYVALVLSAQSKSPELKVIENGNALEERYINYYRNSIRYEFKDTITFKGFWQPLVTESMKKASKIYISLDGVFHKISLNTLFNPASQKFLVDEYNLEILVNTKDILRYKGVRAVNNGQTLFFGYPDYNFKENAVFASRDSNSVKSTTRHLNTRGDFRSAFRGGVISDLPGTKDEVEAAFKLFTNSGNKNVEKALGKAVDESKIKEISQPKVLHIATHGFFIPNEVSGNKDGLYDDESENPLMQSGLLLTGASHAYSEEVILSQIDGLMQGKNVDDGILSAFEAMNLNLTGTELVVLSACETGLGEVKNGEGVFGLQRSLMTAGADCLIISMWKVYDESTNKFMQYFYDEWLKSGDKRKSFHKAQLKLREEYPAAVHWGAFVMIGE